MEPILNDVKLEGGSVIVKLMQIELKNPNTGVCEVPTSLQEILDAGDVPKRGRTKRKVKATEVLSKKFKPQRKPKSKSAVMDEDSEEITKSDVRGENTFAKDTATPLKVSLKASEKITPHVLSKVSTPLSSSILKSTQTPLKSDIFDQMLNEPLLDLYQTPPLPLPFNTNVSIQTNISPLPNTNSESTMPTQTTLHIPTLIFTSSTTNPSVTKAKTKKSHQKLLLSNPLWRRIGLQASLETHLIWIQMSTLV
ncbi:unnamed protein product [Lactuca saligna]|uniref:Uncharacterized protein n=1 Tax=Lactuca saligna TaxID=75948 RepID=A0AA35YK20_LACSI|nr:unnamed protein product [Lactuca saligna]